MAEQLHDPGSQSANYWRTPSQAKKQSRELIPDCMMRPDDCAERGADFTGLTRDVDLEWLAAFHFLAARVKNFSPGSSNSSKGLGCGGPGTGVILDLSQGRDRSWSIGDSTTRAWSRSSRQSPPAPRPSTGHRARPVPGQAGGAMPRRHWRPPRATPFSPRPIDDPAGDQVVQKVTKCGRHACACDKCPAPATVVWTFVVYLSLLATTCFAAKPPRSPAIFILAG